ncbi:MAG: epimerase [Chloroflexi bacterium RBG_19FT_COMBO_50_10]|nr:MAG: epimerase [Chloroflexi bacterium RBG_19FT_COMBO_50_10]
MNLVTGATGHIGNVLVRQLTAMGEKVRTLVLPGEDETPLKNLDVEIVEGDVLDYPSLLTAFDGIDTIFHLAGMISILPDKNPMVQTVNVNGTRNVLLAARQAGAGRLVYTSSIHALRRIPHGTTIDETLPFDPKNAISTYDRSKAQASLEVIRAISDGMDAVICCPTGVIGPYDFRGSEMGALIHDLALCKLMLYIDGAYDFVDVRDVAKGLILARDKGVMGESYILSGERISVIEVVKTVQEIIGKYIPRLKIPLSLARFTSRFTPLYYQLSQAKPRFTSYSLETILSNSVISSAKAKLALGYNPRSLRESLTDTVHWFLQERSHLPESP